MRTSNNPYGMPVHAPDAAPLRVMARSPWPDYELMVRGEVRHCPNADAKTIEYRAQTCWRYKRKGTAWRAWDADGGGCWVKRMA